MTKRRNIKILFLSLVSCLCIALAIVPLFLVNAEQTSAYHKSDIIVANSGVKEIKVGDAFLDKYHVYHKDIKNENMLVPKSESGIGVYSNGGSIDFSYRSAINFTDFTKQNSIIEVYPLFGDNYAKIQDIKIILTDTEDSSNTVGIHFDDNYDGGHIYARVLYRNKDLAYAESSDYLWNGKYGAGLANCTYSKATGGSVIKEWQTGQVSPFTMHLDYQSKVVSSSYYSDYGVFQHRNVLDIDDPTKVGSGLEWKGFTNGTAYVSVQVTFAESVTDTKPGGVIVKSINGVNVDGDFQSNEDIPLPIISPLTQKEYGDRLPNAAVGVEYSIPSVFAYDWFFGIAKDEDVSYVIEKRSGDDYVATDFKGGNGGLFTPTEVGEYRIKYTVKNQVKSGSKEVYFKVNQYLPPIMASLVEDYGVPKLNSYFAIPQTTISGGSGNLVKTETLYYCGQEIELKTSRDLFVDKAGVISLKVEVSGYTGAPYVKYFPVEVQNGIIIKVENMPKAILNNNAETLVLPEPYAYNTADNSVVGVTITADGELVGENRSISTDKPSGEEIEVKYSAGTGIDLVEKVYRVKVIESDTLKQKPSHFMMKEGNVDVQDSVGGILLQTQQNNAGVTWTYPVVTGFASSKMQLSFAQTSADNLDFEYIEVTFSDLKEIQRDFYIRIYKDNFAGPSTEMTSVKINGQDKAYDFNGAINDAGRNLTLFIDAYGIYNSKENLIYDFSSEYSAPLSYVNIKFGGVTGQASIRVDSIANQALAYDEVYGWADSSAVLSFSNRLELFTETKLNAEIKIPSCEAVDTTSSTSSVTLTVKAPDGSKLINAVDCSKDVTFTPTQKGEHVIEYTITDGYGNFARSSYYVLVFDQVNPVLTINGKLKAEIPQGVEILLPSATANDAVDGDCAVSIFVRNLSYYSLVEVKDNKFVFEQAGRYQVIYQTHDASYNYTQYIFTVTVTEGK